MSSAQRAPARFASRLIDLGLCALLVLVVGALYGQTARHEFVSYDDGAYITENRHVRGGLTAANARWAFSEFHSANWHPLTWLSHQLDVELFGLDSGPHHLVNGALHALNAVLCFAFLRRATGSVWASALAALLFAVHPQRVESVAWAAERKDVLSGAFFFLTLLAYERYARGPSLARYGLVVLCFALGLLAKPMLVTVPVVLLLLDVWPLRRVVFVKPTLPSPVLSPSPAPTHPVGEEHGARVRYGILLEKLPLFALAAASSLVTILAQRAGRAVQSMEVLSLPERLATAVLGTLFYVWKAVWPAGLAFFYPHPAFVAPEEFAPLGARVWAGSLLLLALTLGAWRLRGRFPVLLVGWGWMLVMLLPVLGLVQVGAQFYADRYVYLPLLGPTFALVFVAREGLPHARFRRAAFGLGLAVAALFACLSWRQVGTWRDSQALCERALSVTERNAWAHEHLGLFHQRRGELERAQEHYLAALAINPQLPSTHVNLGAAHAQLGRRDEAIAEFKEALRLAPDFLKARLSWGWLLEQERDYAGAAAHYEIAARLDPESSDAWLRLGEVCSALGRHEEAREAHRRALEAGASDR